MNKLYGAILGDLAGQPYEHDYVGDYSEFNIHNPDSHITDDSILTLATAKALMVDDDFNWWYRQFGLKYYNPFFGNGFRKWIQTSNETKNNSYGNGSLMRISPIMYVSDKALRKHYVVDSCLNSHCHPASIISCLRLLDIYENANEMKEVWRSSAIIEPFKTFEVAAYPTIDFIEKAFKLAYDDIPKTTHDRIERVVKCGGDTDTNASIIGELMNYTFNDLTKEDVEYVESKLDSYLLEILKDFNKYDAI